jgi:pimeloyl-ACP methyl ester carboxylesterase
MGIDSWNIWAGSYGTRVALEAIRREESGIRSVILDAPYPPGMYDPLVVASNFDRILTDLIASCPLHRVCQQTAPELPGIFRELLKDLRDNPRELTILSRHSLQVRTYEVDDSAFLALLFRAALRRQGLSSLPFIIIIAHQGRLDFAPIQLSDLVGYSRYVSMGALIQTFCSDGALANPDRIQEAMERFPHLAGWIETFWTDDDCQEVIGHRKAALTSSVVESDLPVLLLSGAFDPVTPTEWAYEAAKHLPNGHLFVFPGESHGVSGNRCAQLIMKRFLDDPDKRPSDPCFLLESGPRPGP